MKLKANFLVNKSIKSDRWPDYTDDRYQIRLPYLSEKFLVPTSSQRILTGSALISVCSIDLFVTQQSAQPLRRAVEQLARYFRREFHYDFCQYSADDDDPDHRAYLWIDRYEPQYRCHTCFYPVIGACCFRHRRYDEHPLPPGIPPDHYALQWIWFHPYQRNQGHLTKALPYFQEQFSRLIAEPPFSPAMDAFLKKHHCWPYENDEQRTWIYSRTTSHA